MNGPVRSFKNQRGAVAIIVGITIAVLIIMIGLVVDLGFLYTRKTELQNAADAAALAGAKKLNGTRLGVEAAAQEAINLAAANNVITYSPYPPGPKPVQITTANIWFNSTPDVTDTNNDCVPDGWSSYSQASASDAAAAGKVFILVDTCGIVQGSHPTWFMHVAGFDTTTTYGMAVAGPYTAQVTPMAVCAVDKTLPEEGFLRGVAYNLPDLNPISNGDPIWINPIDAYPGPCDPNHGNTGSMVAPLCTGTVSSIRSVPAEVWVNTGAQAALEGPLNSRFGLASSYTGGHACSPVTAPADTNVKEFFCTRAGNPNRDNHCPSNPGTNAPQDWMDTVNTPNQLLPFHQTIETQGGPKQGKPFNYPTRSSPEIAANFSRYGVLWSYSRELNYSTTPATPYGTTDWPNLYGGPVETYPASSPYEAYVQAPTGSGAANATAHRRVLNIAIIDCDGVTSIPGQSCSQHLPVLAVGKFFMQRWANLPNYVDAEFAGITSPSEYIFDIRLFR